MEREKNNLIYDYYKCHILFGQLQQGDLLPTIEQIGNIFHVAPQTVRNALKKLQQDRLIDVSPGRNTMVIHQTTPEEALRFTQNYYLVRKNDIGAAFYLAGILLTPIFRMGCQRLSDDDIRQILQVCRQSGSNIVSISMFCCKMILRVVDNELLNTLFSDMVSFFQFPYMTSFHEESSEEYQTLYKLMVSSCEAHDRVGIFQAFHGLQKLTQTILQKFIDETALKFPLPEQIPFHWQTYRDRPQCCHTLAAKIIHGIVNGKYTEGDMLPSYENMASEFSVSVSTARRTAGLLRDMGLLHSINGVGNQITFAAPDWEKLQRPSVLKNIVMAKESAEILLVTVEDVMGNKLSELTDVPTEELNCILTDKKDSCILDSIVLVIEYFVNLYPLPSFCETFGKLLEFLLLAYPFLLNKRNLAEGNDVPVSTEMMIAALDKRDFLLFSNRMLVLLQYVLTQIERIELLFISPK